MTAAAAKELAHRWIGRMRLPEDLRGRVVHLVTFASEEDCRFFYPARALGFQQQANGIIARTVRQRGGKALRVEIKPEAFRDWLAENEQTDSADSRWLFIEGQRRLLE